MTILTRQTLLNLATKLTDMGELEQLRAETINDKVDTMSAGMQALKLGERDRHVARAGAFIEAAKLLNDTQKEMSA